MLPDLEIIKIFRKKSGLTQKKLSKLVGLSQSYINKIENLTAQPPYNVAKKIIELLQKYKNDNEKIILKKIMTKIKTINSSKKLKDAILIMDELRVSQLPVANEGIIVGSLTKKTIPKLIKENIKDILEKKVSEVMDLPFPMIPEDSPIELLSTLLEYNEAVLILNYGKLSGIITKYDLIKIIN
jgi:predicted transcriptional regulator